MEQTQAFVEQFSDLMADLSASRERNAFASQQKLRAAQQELQQVRDESRMALEKMDAEAAYLRELVAQLQRDNTQPIASGSGL